MSDPSLLLAPFLDDDEDVRLVQRYASAGARTGAKMGAAAGPVGAGVGAGFGGAAGFFIGYGVTGVDPSDRRVGGGDDSHGASDGHDADDGPVTIAVTEASPDHDADG
ncbi:hypothetical protein [Haloplanus natans]|uniref:hypothetical protein n=1 Tax=Haloplanus natans TaxID=376171 RepID=UPI000677D823|nr:hypothetical protein [Haloplanus natans]